MSLSGASEALVRRWLDRPENRAEWERLRGALSLAEGFQFFALQVNDPIAELFLEMLLKAEAEDHGTGLAGFDLARPPDEGPAVTVLLRAMEAAPRPAWFFFQGSSKVREGLPALGDLFLYLNQKRDIVAQTAGAPFLLSLPPEGWALFRQAAPDFWSIHTSVYRFTGAEVRREERVREASEEAFLWQTFASFVAVRFLRAVLPPRLPRRQVVPIAAGESLIGRESERRTLRTWLVQPGARILIPGIAGSGKTSLLAEAVADVQRTYPDGVFYFSLRDAGDSSWVMEEVVDALRPGLVVPLLRGNVLQAMFRDVTAEKKILLVLDDIDDTRVLEELTPSPPSVVLAAGRADSPPKGWRRLVVRTPGQPKAPPRKSLREESAGIRLEVISQAAKERGDLKLAAETLGWAALGFLQEGDADGARERLATARELARENGRPDLEALVLRHQAAFWLWTSQIDATAGLAQEVLRLDPKGWVGGDLSILAMLSLTLGEELEHRQIKKLKSLVGGAVRSVSPTLSLLAANAVLGRYSNDSDLAGPLGKLEMALRETADSTEDSGVRSWILALRGEIQLRQRNPVAARESVETALRHARNAYDWEAEAEAWRVLGKILEEAGELSGAESALRRLLEIREQLYSPDHEGAAWAALNLARLLRETSRPEEAEVLYLRAVVIFQKGLPGTSRALVTALFEQAVLLLDLTRHSEAETILREALGTALAFLGPTHFLSTNILLRLAQLADVAGRLEEGEDLLRSTLSILEHSQEPGDRSRRYLLGLTLSLFADVLARRGQIADALGILRDWQLPVFVELGDPQGRALTLSQIGSLLSTQGRHDEALPFIQEELSLFEEVGDVRGRAAALGEMAGILLAQERYDEALPLFQEQLALYERLGYITAAEEVRKALQSYGINPS